MFSCITKQWATVFTTFLLDFCGSSTSIGIIHLLSIQQSGFESSRGRMYSGQKAASGAINVSTEDTKLVENVASMYLNKKFSDVTFLVGGEKLHAHKAILVMKSKRFENLFDENPEKKEVTISNTSPEAFRLFLKYIYTDTITVPTDVELLLQELILADQYSLKQLQSVMVREINSLLDTKNVCLFLNGANDNDLGELLDVCHLFVDDNAVEILSCDSFNNLTQKSVIEIIKRYTFVAPEIEIFNSVAKWCEKNNDVDNLVLECVNLASLSVSQILSIVWPTNLVNTETLLKTISEIVSTDSEHLLPEGVVCQLCTRHLEKTVLAVDENIATVQHGAKVISELDTAVLLTGNTDVKKNIQRTIGGEDGIVICMGQPRNINHIRMLLYDADDRYYSYFIETSLDRTKWERIVDYSGYACRSVQNLYFKQQVVKYIKIVGTSSSIGSDFHLVFFEAFYKSKIPKTINAVICPEINVATPENKTIVVEGANSGHLLNGNEDLFLYSFHYFNDNPCSFIVQLAQPYLISSMQFCLSEKPYSHKYFIETSANKTDWKIVVDRRHEECEGWQYLQFEETLVVFIKITGTYSSYSERIFRCRQFECPSEIKEMMKNRHENSASLG